MAFTLRGPDGQAIRAASTCAVKHFFCTVCLFGVVAVVFFPSTKGPFKHRTARLRCSAQQRTFKSGILDHDRSPPGGYGLRVSSFLLFVCWVLGRGLSETDPAVHESATSPLLTRRAHPKGRCHSICEQTPASIVLFGKPLGSVPEFDSELSKCAPLVPSFWVSTRDDLTSKTGSTDLCGSRECLL